MSIAVRKEIQRNLRYNTNNWKSTEVSIGLIISCIFESDGYCVESSGLDIVAIPESLISSFLIVDIQFVTPKNRGYVISA